MNLRFFLLLSAMFASFGFSFAQIKNPVEWSFSVAHAGGNEYDLICKAKISDGWYIYALDLPEGGPVPTSITIEGENAKPVGKATESVSDPSFRLELFDEIFEIQLTKFKKEVSFTQRFTCTDPSQTIKGFVTAMSCNHETCLPPTDKEFSISLSGTPKVSSPEEPKKK